MEALVLRHEDEFTDALTAEERRTLIRLLMRLSGKAGTELSPDAVLRAD
jgi:hypothetical protein